MFNRQIFAKALLSFALIGAQQTFAQTEFPGFAEAMKLDGASFTWESKQVTSDTGYNSVLFHLTKDQSGVKIADSKGPVLLLHGMYSSPEDWFKRSDALAESTPI